MSWPEPPHGRVGGVSLYPLTAQWVDEDTRAYRAAAQAIDVHSAGRWPAAATFTADENARLVAQHEAEHRAGEAFAYVVVHDEREVGCAYLRPDGDAARLTFWLIDDPTARPSAVDVLGALVEWVRRWEGPPALLRCLPAEGDTVAAAEALALPRVDGPAPYSWWSIGR